MNSLILVLSFPLFVFGQKQGNALIDSLLQKLPKMADDSNKVKALNLISHNYRVIDPDEGVVYGEACMKVARKIKSERWIGQTH